MLSEAKHLCSCSQTLEKATAEILRPDLSGLRMTENRIFTPSGGWGLSYRLEKKFKIQTANGKLQMENHLKFAPALRDHLPFHLLACLWERPRSVPSP